MMILPPYSWILIVVKSSTTDQLLSHCLLRISTMELLVLWPACQTSQIEEKQATILSWEAGREEIEDDSLVLGIFFRDNWQHLSIPCLELWRYHQLILWRGWSENLDVMVRLSLPPSFLLLHPSPPDARDARTTKIKWQTGQKEREKERKKEKRQIDRKEPKKTKTKKNKNQKTKKGTNRMRRAARAE